jgi:hypothetical protein
MLQCGDDNGMDSIAHHRFWYRHERFTTKSAGCDCVHLFWCCWKHLTFSSLTWTQLLTAGSGIVANSLRRKRAEFTERIHRSEGLDGGQVCCSSETGMGWTQSLTTGSGPKFQPSELSPVAGLPVSFRPTALDVRRIPPLKSLASQAQ